MLLFGFGCVTTSPDLETRLAQLESKVAEIEDLGVMGLAEGVGASFYPATGALTGGGTGALDKITSTADKDAAIVMFNDEATYGNAFMPFTLDVDGGGTESAPWLIDSGDGGNEDWELTDVYANELYTKPVDDGYMYFDPDTASESDWYIGPNHDSGGDDNDSLEFRQSATAGTSVELELETDGDLVITGAVVGKTRWGSDITANITLGDDTGAEEVHGVIYQVTAACTVTLEAAATVGFGSTVMLYVRDASETVIVEVDNADKINLHGTPLDAGDTIDSPGNAGDFICLIATTDADGSGTDGWITLGYGEAAWTDGGGT